MTTSFPRISLKPVSDTRSAWVGMLLESQPASDAATLVRIFEEFGLAESLEGIACIVALPDLPSGIEALPAEGTILCLPAAFCCDPANAPTLGAVREKGFRLMAQGLPPAELPLHAGVSALALPCPGVGTSQAAGPWLKKLPGPHLALGAENINCPGNCQFKWITGHVRQESSPARGKGGDAPNRLLLLELLAKVANDAESDEIEAVVKRDPQLSYHLLKLVNSVGFSLNAKIKSFGQAITLLGRRQLQRWLQLLLYARDQKGDSSNPLLPRAAFRAGLAEALARVTGGTRDVQDRAFMTGMFSMLDVLFGMPLAEIIKPLNISDDVVSALTDRSGALGALLAVVEEGETGAGDGLAAKLAAAGIGAEDWARCLSVACRWAIQVSREA